MIYIVLPGDTLYQIAQRFKTSIALLLMYNPQITNSNFIYPGQIINLPPTGHSYKLCPILRQGDRGPAVSRIQILLRNQGLYTRAIDGIYGPLTQRALLTWQQNTKELEVTGIVDEETWVSLGFECNERPEIVQYIVRPGSSLFAIAIWFGVSVDSLLQVNPQITNPNQILPGQIINIPASFLDF
ncbi:LysM peptidoglycan-binding domain-containing protein [Fredinandcohnia sp. FSL W7-1320]|uniref:LysM peptidoglycan-binding domain-containing protein n=1 Tax=Fredinandcohnia sp. FSL W7-1320 TaxID=2954540 RepID=UPI0030FD60A2